VNASLVDNFPGALLEASAAGLVVVTTAAGGIPFIYENGRTAFLVKPGDSSALAESIEYILEHRGVAMRMAEAARTVASPCEWSEVRKQLFYAYGCSAESISAGAASLNGAGCAAG